MERDNKNQISIFLMVAGASQMKAFNLLISNMIMMIPTVLRFIKTKRGFDFGILLILIDGISVYKIY